MEQIKNYKPEKETAYKGPLKYWGKYRGIVINNVDDLGLGRLQAEIPALSMTVFDWALPCSPFAGPLVGFYAIPPMGANVWIEFEGGNPNHPIWVGGFWVEGEMPLEPVIPTNHVMKTKFIDMQWNDTPEEGGFSLTVTPPVAPVIMNMTFNEEGITITCPPNIITINPEGITQTVPGSVVTQTEGIMEVLVSDNSFTWNETGMQAEYPNMSLTGPIEVKGIVQVTGDVSITGNITVLGNVTITGLVEINGNVNVNGAVEINGFANLLGALAVELETNLAGALTVEGEANVSGALTVDPGLIVGVVVPIG